MMQTRVFLMFDRFQASQLASGPGKSRKCLFIADVKTSTTTYAFNTHEKQNVALSYAYIPPCSIRSLCVIKYVPPIWASENQTHAHF